MDACLKCGNTGMTINGDACDCGYKNDIILPTSLAIPAQYQNIRFDKAFLPKWLQEDYGTYMEKLIGLLTKNINTYYKNVMICAPSNSGKTIFSYTVCGMLFAKGLIMPELKDLLEVRQIFMDYYSVNTRLIELYSTSKLAIIKIPMDLPSKFPEIIATIVERRVRNNCSTIFLYSGSKEDLMAQDTFGKMKSLIGDGNFHSIEVRSWKNNKEG